MAPVGRRRQTPQVRRYSMVFLVLAPLLTTGCSDGQDRYSPEEALERCDLVPRDLRHGITASSAVPGPYDSPISGKVDAGDVECSWQVMFTEDDVCPDGETLTPGPKESVTAVVHSDDSYDITGDVPHSQNCSDPTVGVAWANGTEGYGEVAPVKIYNGGVPTGSVFDIEWENWGGDTAIGHGTGYYETGTFAAGALAEPATVVAFDLGQCDGQLAYRQVHWFFTGKGEEIDLSGEPNYDICTPYVEPSQ